MYSPINRVIILTNLPAKLSKVQPNYYCRLTRAKEQQHSTAWSLNLSLVHLDSFIFFIVDVMEGEGGGEQIFVKSILQKDSD